MRKLVMAFVYTALLTGANGSFAEVLTTPSVRASDLGEA